MLKIANINYYTQNSKNNTLFFRAQSDEYSEYKNKILTTGKQLVETLEEKAGESGKKAARYIYNPSYKELDGGTTIVGSPGYCQAGRKSYKEVNELLSLMLAKLNNGTITPQQVANDIISMSESSSPKHDVNVALEHAAKVLKVKYNKL